MPNLGPMEVAIVLMIALLILGPKRLPETGRSMSAAVCASSATAFAATTPRVASSALERHDDFTELRDRRAEVDVSR